MNMFVGSIFVKKYWTDLNYILKYILEHHKRSRYVIDGIDCVHEWLQVLM